MQPKELAGFMLGAGSTLRCGTDCRVGFFNFQFSLIRNSREKMKVPREIRLAGHKRHLHKSCKSIPSQICANHMRPGQNQHSERALNQFVTANV